MSRLAIYTGPAVLAAIAALLFTEAAHADAIISDTLTINLRGINDKKSLTIEEMEGFESKRIIDLGDAIGFVGKDGYVLLCEPPLNACGPQQGFKGVSDLLFHGRQGGNRNRPGLFFFSDSSEPLNAAAILTSAYGVKDPKKVPAPLGMMEETGRAQPIGKLFRFADKNAVILTSDLDTPEPATAPLCAFAIAAIILAAAASGETPKRAGRCLCKRVRKPFRARVLA